MFSRLASALYSAVDALAPPLPLLEDFIWHWMGVTNFYSEKTSSNKIPIEATRIPSHLNHMSATLEQEEEESESGSMGPCMEYLIHNKILDTMCLFARSDTPPGMKRHMLAFATRLLKNSQQSLLPHINIYSPVQKFIQLCGETLAAPTEREEIDFLDVICLKLKENPHLVNCFISISSSDASHENSIVIPPEGSEHDQKSLAITENVQYFLVKSLLTLLQSADSDIALRSGNCLLLCTSSANDLAAFAIAHHTSFCQTIIKCLSRLYASVPKSLKSADIDEAAARWGHDVAIASDSHLSSGKRKLLCFLRWLDFLDNIAQQAHPVICDLLVFYFKTEFLDCIIYQDLIDENDEMAVLITTLISCCLRHISSSKLMTVFGQFLLGEFIEPEIPGRTAYILKNLLIERCRNNKSPQLSMATLQLFEELLQKPTENILQNLVLCNLVNRGYYDNMAADNYFNYSDDDDLAGRYMYDDDVSPGSSPVSRTFAPTHIHRILNCFLMLLPDEIKCCDSEEDSGYDTYIKDAHSKFMECLSLCDVCDWPQEPLGKEEQCGHDDDSSSDSQPEVDSTGNSFYEGHFLNMVFDKIEQMLHQPYEVNLQVTSLISRLALFPHPNLHEYILNPLIPLTPGARSLFMVLLKVVEDIQIEIQAVPNFKKKLHLTRRALLSEETEYTNFEDSAVLEALIVVEEFCKELAAIAFVKYHAAS